ncbi:MAG TPA: two-component system response regulator [Rhodospirillaceae bacterium]|nr:two-component system response regulator [Rhodospirillaceae bacterium]HAA92495.1 two-component system response regulator [Rhodospirillaceae bacterium]HAT35237.1 two-component system response regulator [Rhodospirillaceae bacterium]
MTSCLVIDDSRVIRAVARRILETLSIQVGEAEDGQAGLAACKEKMPDGVLLDWNMPNMDGMEFLQALRRLPGGDQVKVVFCTTENNLAHIEKAVAAGAQEYVMKPFDLEILHSKFSQVGLL